MKKLSLKYLLERIQKIENEYQRKPKIYTVQLHKKYEKEAIDDLKKLGWKEIIDYNSCYIGSLINEMAKLEKKVY